MPKSPTIIVEDITKDSVAKVFGESGVTMVRLATRDKKFAQNLQFVVSARLERDGLYNIREARKVIHRGYSREAAIDYLVSYAGKLQDPVAFGVIREVVAKAKPTAQDLLNAVSGQPA